MKSSTASEVASWQRSRYGFALFWFLSLLVAWFVLRLVFLFAFKPAVLPFLDALRALLSGFHRDVFVALLQTVPMFFWFLILPGPSGAVLYRLAGLLEQKWGSRSEEDYGEFGQFARKVFHYIDWIPVRLTAMSFAIAGDFEDAVHCWRTQATAWMQPERGVVLASGAGALGVRLGETLHHNGTVSFRPELGLGDEADVNTMTSAVGMIWRALVIWLLVLGLVAVARWVGG